MKKQQLIILFLLLAITGAISAQNATIYFQIIDQTKGALTPARLTILQNGKPVALAVPSKLNIASRENSIYTASGTGTFSMKPGQYEFWFSKGMEYTIDAQQITLLKGEVYFLSAYLQRAINTDGFVCGDMHLHTLTNSGHGDANLIERVISCAAEGLEWAVSTDHNFVTDYQPYLEAAGLNGVMKTSIGNEVSSAVGHYNTYPLKKDSKVVDSSPKDPGIIFKNIRDLEGKDILIHINHPREYAPLFSLKGLDPYFGTINNPEWSWDFDALEILNSYGLSGWRTSPTNLQSVKRDWFNLLNQNIRTTGLGNSDSHAVISNIAGVPRNYILSGTDIPSEIDEWELAKNIKAQRVSVACGLFTRLLVNGKNAMGETYSVQNKAVELQLLVQGAPWVDCSSVELVRNGAVVQSFDLRSQQGAAVIRLDTLITIKPERDSWYVLIAKGEKNMYPMAGHPNIPTFPLGFTNPVWIKAIASEPYESIFDYAKYLVEKEAHNSETLLAILQKEPGAIPIFFYHLFEQKNKNARAIAKTFFAKADTDQRRILFRELAKTDLPGAQTLMEDFQKEKLTPLEEVILASFIHFPIRASRMDQFKNKKDDTLDEQLGFVETELSYIYSEAIQQKVKIGYSNNNVFPDTWEDEVSDKDAIFHLTKKESGAYFLKIERRLLKDSNLPFYMNTNQRIQTWVNGKQSVIIPANDNKNITSKFVELPLFKGKNEIIFQLSAMEPSSISFQHADNKLIIDPNVIREEVEHLALNCAVEYLTEYNFKYHGNGIALTDGYRGSKSFATQIWQGWFGKNAEFIIDIGTSKSIQEVSVGLLIDQRSWILLPKKMEVFTSLNGNDYESVFESELDALKQLDVAMLKTIAGKIDTKEARYIKVIATAIDELPDWHKSKGNDAWIFLDEVIVK